MLKTVILWLESTLSFYKIVQVTWSVALFCNTDTEILDHNRVKDLRGTEIVKQFTFEGALGELEARNDFQR